MTAITYFTQDGQRHEVTVQSCIAELSSISDDIVTVSLALQQVEKSLEPLEREYDEEFSDFEAGLFERYENGEGKWPGEEARDRMFRRTLPPERRNNLLRLRAARKRGEKRLGWLAKAADGQRSVLSALKIEAEATR